MTRSGRPPAGARGLRLAAAIAAAVALNGTPARAELPAADVYVLGELHDNAAHHLEQARLIEGIDPTAIVFEMLTPGQAARVSPVTPRDLSLGDLLGWDDAGWPDFATYLPIFRASDAPVVGAGGTDAADLSAFGLDLPLPPAQQAAREAIQAAAHCDALPPDLLPGFVARQRERDARFARATLDALDAHGAPVVLITGNGHARTDWGVPALIARAAPDVAVVSVVQAEGANAAPPGDVVLRSDPAPRADPCAAFRARMADPSAPVDPGHDAGAADRLDAPGLRP